MKKILSILALAALASSASAITVQVDPVSGTDNGASPFLTLEAALTAVAGADAGADTINILDTGVLQLGAGVVVGAAAADGNLTIQADGSNTGDVVIALGASGGPAISVEVEDGVQVDFNDLIFIANSAGTSGDGFQIFNASGTPAAFGTANFSNCRLAGNDGSNNPMTIDQSITTAGGTISDDWLDYFPHTAGTLTTVTISQAGDEGVIIRGDGAGTQLGAVVTMTGGSVVSHNGGRAFQPVFGPDGDPVSTSNPTLTLQGSEAVRIRVFENVETSPEPTFTLFNGFITLNYVDIVNNNDIGVRVDTDTADSLSIDHCRIAGNNGPNIWFGWVTNTLTNASITNTTIHDSSSTTDNVAIEVTGDVTNAITIDISDSIISGTGDQIQVDGAPVLNITNSAIVTSGAYSLGSPAFSAGSATETGVINVSPNYVSVVFDGTDPQNPEFLQPNDFNSEYLTAGTGGTELDGGNGLGVAAAPPVLTGATGWTFYE